MAGAPAGGTSGSDGIAGKRQQESRAPMRAAQPAARRRGRVETRESSSAGRGGGGRPGTAGEAVAPGR